MIYYIQGDNLCFNPVPSSYDEVRIYYIKQPTTLSSDSDTIDLKDDYRNAIAYRAASKICRRMMSKNIEKYATLLKFMEDGFEREMDRLNAIKEYSGERVLTVGYRDF